MKKLVVILTFLAARAFPAPDSSLQEELRQQYANPAKIHILRNFFTHSFLKYDLAGNLLGKGESGPWTLYGGVAIEHLALKPDKLELHGRRQAFIYDQKQAKLVAERWDEIAIEIATIPTPDQPAQLRAALAKVFTVPGKDTLDSLPDYWQPYYSGTQRKKIHVDFPQKGGEAISATALAGRLKKRVDPVYSDLAKAARTEGTCEIRAIIDKTGRVKDLFIAQPVGGVDEEVIKAVRQWEYEPYRLNGELVEVETTISVVFHR